MQLTANTRSFIESEQYSSFILMNLHDGLLGDQFVRNVSDFGSGETLNIKTVGSVVLQEASENTPLEYNPIETGSVTLTITDFKGDAWYVSDELREDGAQIDALMVQRSMESTRAIQENYETRFLEVAASGHTDGDTNAVNGWAHRVVSTATNNIANTGDFIALKLAANKANVPHKGRVFFVDSTVEAALNNLVTITSDVTPFAKDVLSSGLASDMSFFMNIFGWDLVVTNRLPTGTSLGDGTTTVANAVVNIGMCVLDDQCKPVMVAWRRQPKTEGQRNIELGRDEYITKTRYGLGIQRTDTLFTYVTSAVHYK